MKNGATFFLILFTCVVSLFSTNVRAEEKVSFKAVMIYATNEPGEQDTRLKQVEPKLRGVFRFKRYQHYGAGSSSTALPGKASLSLGKGHKLDLKVSHADQGKVRAQVRWTRGGEKLMSTAYVLNRKDSTVIGGPSHDKGKLIVVLSIR